MSSVANLCGSSLASIQRKSNGSGSSRVNARQLRSVAVVAKKEEEIAFVDQSIDRRTLLASVSVGVAGLFSASPSYAINTYSTPKPFTTDSEKYLGRPGETLGPNQMYRMRYEFKELAKSELMEAVPKMPGAYPGLLKLAFMDATTFDVMKRYEVSAGANGSVHLSEELDRPENAGMKALVSALEPVKASIDSQWAAKAAASGNQRAPPTPISWADLIAMAAVVATIQNWGASPVGGFPVRQGRVDTLEADPKGRSLSFSADYDTAKAWFSQRSIPPSEMIPVWMEVTDNLASVKANGEGNSFLKYYEQKPDEFKKQFITGFTKLTSLGSSYDAFAYFYDESPFKGKENKGLQ